MTDTLSTPPVESSGAASDVSPRRRQGILAAMSLALVGVVASVSGLNVALGELSVALDASGSALLWIVNAYTLTMAALLLPVGEIGDRIGRRTILVAGLAVFGVANLLAMTAGSAGQMIVYRVIAGVGAAMIMPATLSTLTSVFPPEERGRAVGVWSGFAGAGGILGLFASAFLIDFVSWQLLFVLPAATAVVGIALTLAIVPNTRSSETHRIDVVGGVLSAIGVGGLVLGIHEGPEVGWTAPITVAGLVAGALGLVAFVLWSLRREHPLLDMRIFSNRRLAAGSMSLTVMFALIFGVFLVVIQYLQLVLGMSALRAAAGLLPMAIVMMGLSPQAPRLAARFGYGRILGVGTAALIAGFVLLGLADGDPSYLAILPGLIAIGLGVGLAMSPSTTAITESMPEDKQGVASALNDTVREFGSAVGVALIGSVLSAGYAGSIEPTTATLPEELAEPVGEGIGQALAVSAELGPDGAPIAEAARTAFLSGWGTAMTVAAVTAALAGLGAVALLRRDRDTADDVDLDAEPDIEVGIDGDLELVPA
ncbi:MAG: MFS transporter [Ilumatobacter sp.]|uniref:MFS transporter n=1 Tax=Ilumatobacter sp. TaxID=1967498 RepID=UPI002608AFBA|nr:MFS transporter [Ilumatobacter sp.]MDJ0771674.1 MFS transporter [Ilumatobacter sp.]